MIKTAILHHVIALSDGKRVVSFTQMPFASEVSLVPRSFENGRKRPLRRWQPATLALESNSRHSAAIGNSTGLHCRPAGSAAWLRIEGIELHAFIGHPIEIGR